MKGAITVDETTMTQPTLQIPLQSAPVDRTPAGAAAFGLAAIHTFRAARRGHAPPAGRTDP